MADIFKLNDKIVNNITLEEYDSDTGEWVPVKTEWTGSDNDNANVGKYSLHTTPYVSAENTAVAAAYAHVGKTLPADGMMYAKMEVNCLMEVYNMAEIVVKDETGETIKTKMCELEISGLRPDYTDIGTYVMCAVKKGWTVDFTMNGVGGAGVMRTFVKIDPTYRVTKNNGEYRPDKDGIYENDAGGGENAA